MHGYVQGQNISIVYRSSDGRDELLPELASQLLQLNVGLLVTFGTLATEAAQRATRTVPIVMVTVLDPVRAGFVANLSHPGGNVTGSSDLSEELVAKRVELLSRPYPRLTARGALGSQRFNECAGSTESRGRASALGIRFAPLLRMTGATSTRRRGYERWRPQALLVLSSSAAIVHSGRILELQRDPPAGDIRLTRRRAGRRTSLLRSKLRRPIPACRSVRGENPEGRQPADLPSSNRRKFELVVNLKTAKALGLTIPESILLRADEVIR